MKAICFNRCEYIKEFYRITYSEMDYLRLLKWLSKRDDVENMKRFEVFKDLSFEDIIAIIEEEKEDIVYELGLNISYKESVRDYMMTELRNIAIDNGYWDSDCIDVYENIEIEDYHLKNC